MRGASVSTARVTSSGRWKRGSISATRAQADRSGVRLVLLGFLNQQAMPGVLSAADCVALLREAALSAMRRSIDATGVTAADVAKARETVRPSLDHAEVEALRAFYRVL